MNHSGREKPLLWIFAGELSGDIYGGKLASELKKRLPDAQIAGMGSENMKRAGVDIMVDSSELGVVGIVEILGKMFEFVKIFRMLVKRAVEERPDVVVLIDYPGFNIRFAKKMYENDIPVIWYISPQVWAWRKANIPRLAKYCRKMMVIFPFETDVYAGTGLDVEFVGHPLVDIVEGRKDPALKRDPDRVLLLPGSRKAEIKRLFLPMLETALILHSRRPELKFSVSASGEKNFERIKCVYEKFVSSCGKDALPGIEIKCGETARLLQESGTGLAASGTVTVECCIAKLPLVVIYKLNPITFRIARILVKLFRGFFTMVNIIADGVVYEEFLQFQVVPEALADAMEKILPGGDRREEVEREMARVRSELKTGAENAGAKAADAVIAFLRNPNG